MLGVDHVHEFFTPIACVVAAIGRNHAPLHLKATDFDYIFASARFVSCGERSVYIPRRSSDG